MDGIPKPIILLGIISLGMVTLYLVRGPVPRVAPVPVEHLTPPRESSQTQTVTNNSPPEVLLPFIDTGEREIDRRLVALYANLLDQLDARCRQDRGMISDQSVAATRMIADNRGLDISNARFLREWLDAVQALFADPSRDCAPVAATLAVMIRG